MAQSCSQRMWTVPNALPPPCLSCPAQTYQFPAILSFQYSTDGGKFFADGSVDVMNTVMAQQTMVDSDTRFFDAEILSIKVQPAATQLPILLRESPSTASLG